MRAGVIVLTLLLATAPAAVAQVDRQGAEDAESKQSYLYQWSDDKGVVHITDGLGKVPERYRGTARKLESPAGEEAGNAGIHQGQPESPVRGPEAGNEAQEKSRWQERQREARQRLNEAQERFAALEKKRDELLMSWGGPASGRLSGRVEADRVAEEMKEAQKDIDDARNELEVVIPDEARKAGVPPGWLRE